jgi:hypothetical protein
MTSSRQKDNPRGNAQIHGSSGYATGTGLAGGRRDPSMMPFLQKCSVLEFTILRL